MASTQAVEVAAASFHLTARDGSITARNAGGGRHVRDTRLTAI